MQLVKISKSIGRFSGWLTLCVCSFIVRFLPEKSLYVFANALARIAFLVVIRHRRIALDSLSIAFGQEKSPQEIKAIAQESFIFMARSAVELLYFMQKPHLVRQRVTLQNKHVLDNALARGKGVILVSGHFGNFPLMMLRLSLEGYSVGGIMRHMRDARVERMFARLRNNLGIKAIHSQPRKACVEQTIRALKNNEIVCIQLDQNFGSAGVFVDFFGQKAATATGPVVFALRTKAALLPGFIIRQTDNTHRIIFENEFDLKEGNTADTMIQHNIQSITAIIESYIRRYPAHWGWIHRRWKTRPRKLNNTDVLQHSL